MKRNKQDNRDSTTPYVDTFDRAIGVLDGLPDVAHSQVAVRRVVPLLGVGGTQLYVVQTYRQKEQGDTIFLEHVSETGTVRLVIPPQVSSVIARQREQLTAKTRSKSAKAVAQARKERGEVPAFLKSNRKAMGRP
jgi:hypothetical protein